MRSDGSRSGHREQQIKTTHRNTLTNLKKIQQHGLIDLEVQQQFNAVLTAYKACLQAKDVGPADWNQLMQYDNSQILVQDAMKRQAKIAFGLTSEQMRDKEMQSKNLVLMPNSDSGVGGWSMEISGFMHELNGDEFESATLANQ